MYFYLMVQSPMTAALKFDRSINKLDTFITFNFQINAETFLLNCLVLIRHLYIHPIKAGVKVILYMVQVVVVTGINFVADLQHKPMHGFLPYF